MSDTQATLAPRYRLRRDYVAGLLAEAGATSARTRADALGISYPTAWRLFHQPADGETETFPSAETIAAVCHKFPGEPFDALWERIGGQQ